MIPARLGWRVAVAGGTDAASAERAAQMLIANGATALVSFGLAGGLDPALLAGALLIPDTILDEAGRLHATDAGLRQMLGAGATGTMLASSAIVASVTEKARAFVGKKCVAVDLESGAVARVAAAHGRPFAVLRAVCDPATRALPPAALTALDGRTGAIGFFRVAVSVLRQPGQVGALLALARDAAVARTSLTKALRAIS